MSRPTVLADVSLVVHAPFTYVSHETAYAGTHLVMDVPAGVYPVRLTDIGHVPVLAGERPYYAHVDLPVSEVRSVTHGVSSSAPGPYLLTRYAYAAVDDASAVSEWVDGVLVSRAVFRSNEVLADRAVAVELLERVAGFIASGPDGEVGADLLRLRDDLVSWGSGSDAAFVEALRADYAWGRVDRREISAALAARALVGTALA